ncbi:MAG: LptA/OstA family protein [Armatimonadota bacterium]
MRKFIILVSLIAQIFLCAVWSSADNMTIGQIKLSAVDIVIETTTITATGKAALSSPGASIKANNILIDLQNKGGGFSKGTAHGNVVIHAKQMDKATGAYRLVDATSETAVMAQGQNNIVLTGNVIIKLTDPERLDSPGVFTGETVTVYLNANKIRVQGSQDKPAELNITPKEKPKSQTGQK